MPITAKFKKLFIDDSELLSENERRSNIFSSVFLLVTSVVCMALFLVSLEDIADMHASFMTFFIGSFISFVPGVVCLIEKGRGTFWKYILMFCETLSLFLIAMFALYSFWYLFIIPIFLSCRYFNEKFSFHLSLLVSLFAMLYFFLSIPYSISTGWFDTNAINLSDGISLEIDGGLGKTLVREGYVTWKDILMYDIPQIVLCFVSIFAATYITYIVSMNGKKLLIDLTRKEREKNEQERINREMQTNIMISQIQPHFLYNSLSAIMSIEGNPPETVNALGEFGKYLRENLNTISSADPIPFASEMRHVKRYVSLEKLRFGDHVTVNYDLQTESFMIPPLTVQMMVENAIKHGITKREFGGTVDVSSKETEDEYVIVVKDDGVGFDMESIPENNTVHVGIGSVSKRVENMMGGHVDIHSVVGSGTTVTIHIPKFINNYREEE